MPKSARGGRQSLCHTCKEGLPATTTSPSVTSPSGALGACSDHTSSCLSQPAITGSPSTGLPNGVQSATQSLLTLGVSPAISKSPQGPPPNSPAKQGRSPSTTWAPLYSPTYNSERPRFSPLVQDSSQVPSMLRIAESPLSWPVLSTGIPANQGYLPAVTVPQGGRLKIRQGMPALQLGIPPLQLWHRPWVTVT